MKENVKKYKVLSTIFISSGCVELTDGQAAVRARNLKHIDGGMFEITGTVCFKAGEVLGMDRLDLSLAEKVKDLSPAPAIDILEPRPAVLVEKQEVENVFPRGKKSRKNRKGK